MLCFMRDELVRRRMIVVGVGVFVCAARRRRRSAHARTRTHYRHLTIHSSSTATTRYTHSQNSQPKHSRVQRAPPAERAKHNTITPTRRRRRRWVFNIYGRSASGLAVVVAKIRQNNTRGARRCACAVACIRCSSGVCVVVCVVVCGARSPCHTATQHTHTRTMCMQPHAHKVT